MKRLFALAFVVWSFEACAQTSDGSTELVFEFDDYFGEITEVGAFAAQTPSPGDATGQASGAAERNGAAADIRGGPFQSSDNAAPERAAVSGDDKSGFGYATEESPASTEIVTQEHTVEPAGTAENANPVATGAAVQSSEEAAPAQAAIWWDDRLSFDDESPAGTEIAAQQPAVEAAGTAENANTVATSTAVQSSDDAAPAQAAIWWDDRLSFDDETAAGTAIVTQEHTVEPANSGEVEKAVTTSAPVAPSEDQAGGDETGTIDTMTQTGRAAPVEDAGDVGEKVSAPQSTATAWAPIGSAPVAPLEF